MFPLLPIYPTVRTARTLKAAVTNIDARDRARHVVVDRHDPDAENRGVLRRTRRRCTGLRTFFLCPEERRLLHLRKPSHDPRRGKAPEPRARLARKSIAGESSEALAGGNRPRESQERLFSKLFPIPCLWLALVQCSNGTPEQENGPRKLFGPMNYYKLPRNGYFTTVKYHDRFLPKKKFNDGFGQKNI